MSNNMNKYQKDLQALRPHDEIQNIEQYTRDGRTWDFISTASHGFLIVPVTNLYYQLAVKVQNRSCYGYRSPLAIYLEEDCQAVEFLDALPKGEPIQAVL